MTIKTAPTFFLTALCLAFFVMAAPSYASPDDRTAGYIPVEETKTVDRSEVEPEQQEQEGARPKTLPVKYKNIESTGLYASTQDRSLGKDIWDNAHRSLLLKLLSQSPDSLQSFTLRKLQKRALLTKPDAQLIRNDIEIKPGHDFLTARLERLLAMGFYREAFDLYALLNTEPYHEKLARAGVLAMLYSNEKSLACLETNIVKDRFKEDIFWKELVAYCNVSLSDKPDRNDFKTLRSSEKKILQNIANNANYRFVYTPQKFEALSPLEQAILVAENRLGMKFLSSFRPEEIPTRHLDLLLNQKSFPESHRLALTVRAVEQAVYETEALEKLYNISAEPASGGSASQKNIEAPTTWEAPGYYYRQIQNDKNSKSRWQKIQSAFAGIDQYGIAALLPFARMIQNTKPGSPTLKEIEYAVRIMSMANLSIPEHWQIALDKFKENSENNNKTYKKLRTALYFSTSSYKRKKEESREISMLWKESPEKRKNFLNIIIENIDKRGKDNDNAPRIYEKDFDLTLTDDYVMPSVNVWDRLNIVSQNKSIGETILLSSYVLNGTKLSDTYPGVFGDVLNSFNTVGLTNVSRELAIEALLEE